MRRAVCRRCRVVMDETPDPPEFYHPSLHKDQVTPRKCPHVGRTFVEGDEEIELRA